MTYLKKEKSSSLQVFSKNVLDPMLQRLENILEKIIYFFVWKMYL